MGSLFVPHLIISNNSPITEELLGPALTCVYAILGGMLPQQSSVIATAAIVDQPAPRRCEQGRDTHTS